MPMAPINQPGTGQLRRRATRERVEARVRPRLSSSVTPCAFLKWGLPQSLDLTVSTRPFCQLAAVCAPSSAVGLQSHATMENLNVCWGSELGPQFMLEQ